MLNSKEQIGKLDRRVAIVYPTTSPDEYNQQVPTYAVAEELWAKIEDEGGSESYQADQLTAIRRRAFTIRYKSWVNETHRFLFDGRYYDIQYIKELDRKSYMKVGTILLDDPKLTGPAYDEAYSNDFDAED